MMVGFFLPGDTLLFSAGILAAGGALNIVAVLFTIAAAAIAGDNMGYHIGRKLGPRLFIKPDSIIFRKEYIERAELFYKRYGSKTMLIAHFIPVVRAFVPVTAGAGKMQLKQFMLFDAIGDIAWTLIITLLGYYLGTRIPGVEKYIEPVLLLIILVSLGPALWHILHDPKFRAAIRRRIGWRRGK